MSTTYRLTAEAVAKRAKRYANYRMTVVRTVKFDTCLGEREMLICRYTSKTGRRHFEAPFFPEELEVA